jgi:hypothetical protein
MKKTNYIFMSMLFVVAVLVMYPQPAQSAKADDTSGKVDTGGSYTVFGKPLKINGFVTQESAMGLDAKYSGRNLTDYFSAQIEWEYKLTDWMALYGINRVLGDMAYAIHDNEGWYKEATSTPAQHRNSRRNLSWETNRYDEGWEVFRELYTDISAGDFKFRLGKQQVIWGESDGLRLMDCINPQDLRREFNLRDSDEGYEYTRIPLWLLKANYFPGWEPFGIRDLNFEFIVNPGKAKVNRLEAYESEGGVWAAEEPNLPTGVRVQLTSKAPHTNIKNAEFAGRIMGDWDGWLFTLNAFYGRQQDFFLRPTGPTLCSWDKRFLQLNFDQVYDYRKLVGFTVNKELTAVRFRKTTAPVLRIESLYEFDKPFQYEGDHVGDMAWTGLNGAYKDCVKMKDQIRSMVGLDWNIYIRPLNQRESFFFSTQFFMFYTRDQEGQYVNAPFYFSNKVKQDVLPPLPPSRGSNRVDPWRIHQTQKYFSFLVNTYYFNKRITPQVLYLYDFEEKAHALKAKINFSYGSHWRPELGFMAWWGDTNTGKSFGLFQKNKQVYAKLKYQF